MKAKKAKVVSFVSFKGGSGRSVTLANVAYQLAKKYRVGCLDLDIEAGGLHKILNVGNPRKDSVQHYIVEFVKAAVSRDRGIHVPSKYEDPKVFEQDLVIDIANTTSHLRDDPSLGPSLEQGLFLIQAAADPNLAGAVDPRHGMFGAVHELLEVFSARMKLDLILVDCRSGLSTLSLPGLSYCDVAAFFLRWGTQHRWGTEALMRFYKRWIDDGQSTLGEAWDKRSILLVPSSIDRTVVSRIQIESFIENELDNVPEAYVIIPQFSELAAEDKVFQDSDGHPATNAYQDLASHILNTVGIQ